MSKRDLIRKELSVLSRNPGKLFDELICGERWEFGQHYQTWYTKALKAVETLAPDRLVEFRKYYEIDPKRKELDQSTFAIQDFLRGTDPLPLVGYKFDRKKEAIECFFMQRTILNSIVKRIDSVIADIEGELYAELQESEIVTATRLARINLRAAGALVGVVIEGHLQKVASRHGLKVTKKNPAISDLNELLKSAGAIDTPVWRKISFLADLRNLCSHKKSVEPTKEQDQELIQGAEWVAKNVF